MGIGWHPRLASGIDLIDAAHVRILETVDALTWTARAIGDDGGDAFVSTLDRLNDQTVRHFQLEERLLLENLDRDHAHHHAQEHLHLVRLLHDARIGAEQKDGTMAGRQGSHIAMATLLQRWLIKEISETDPHFLGMVKMGKA